MRKRFRRARSPLSVRSLIAVITTSSLLTALVCTAISYLSFGRVVVESRVTMESPAKPEPAVKAEIPIVKITTEHIPPDEQYRVAIHEAGHAIVERAVMPELPLESLWVAVYKGPGFQTLGETSLVRHENLSFSDLSKILSVASLDWLLRRIPFNRDERISRVTDVDLIWSLGGGAAEKVIFGTAPAFDVTDRYVTEDSIVAVCAKSGVCGECPSDKRVGNACLLLGVTSRPYDEHADRAARIIEANKETTVLLANLIMEQPVENNRRTLNREQISAFMQTHTIVNVK